MDDLPTQISALLAQGESAEATWQKVLNALLVHFKSETGTVHRLDATANQLHLTAQAGLPPALLPVISLIPVGKGIAGQVVARGGPVSICNIQSDKSGVAKPGAKQTGVGGALCVPLRADGVIVGTIGVGTSREYEYTAEETQLLEEVGKLIGSSLAK